MLLEQTLSLDSVAAIPVGYFLEAKYDGRNISGVGRRKILSKGGGLAGVRGSGRTDVRASSDVQDIRPGRFSSREDKRVPWKKVHSVLLPLDA